MDDFESVDDPYFSDPYGEGLQDLQPEMRLAVEDARKLLLIARTMLVELRLRNVDANNIVALVELLYKRGEINAK